ncbi:MAG: DNA repair protein RecO [Bacteroidota bacterium]
MLLKTRGIVLRTLKYSETSIIAEIYTEAKGLRKYIISGVRTAKPKFSASLLQLMSLVDIVAYERDNRELQRIKELKAAVVYSQLPFDVRRSAVGLFLIEIAQKTLKEASENAILFYFLLHTFIYLDRTPHPIANIPLHFLLHLSVYLGFAPNGISSEDTPYFNLREGTFLEFELLKYDLSEVQSKAVSQLLDLSIENCHQCSMTRKARWDLLEQLILYYQLHLENFGGAQAHTILKEVLG